MRPRAWATLLLAAAVGLLGSTGCTTNSFCFNDCAGSGDAGADGPVGDSGRDVVIDLDSGPDAPVIHLDSGPTDGCVWSNGGVETCDGLDDNCDGIVDNVTDKTELSKPTSCGTCATDCTKLLGQGSIGPTCKPPATLDGKTPGTCGYTKCDPDYRDKDGNPQNGCEYKCPFTPVGPEICDNQDNNCNGQVDEGFNLCSDTNNCGKCGHKCVIPHGTAKCTSTATGNACNSTNTTCEVASCDPGYFDVDGSPDNGCEYKCQKTGPEICDGKDNDCDGKIDNVDPDLETGDPKVGKPCFGGTQGECASTAHQGVSKCIGGQITCCDASSNNVSSTNPNLPVTGVRNGVCKGNVGPFILKPNQQSELCDGKDDNCNGKTDDNPINAGGVCGSSVGNCQAGTQQCVVGALKCVGNTNPQPDICNGQDDNCDGVIDGTIPTGVVKKCTQDSNCPSGELCLIRSGPSDKVCANPPSDAVGDCNVPPPPPAGVPQPCKKGSLRCVGGVKACIGSIGPASTVDACGVDSNCDGALTNQPQLKSDVHNCGSCGNDCYANAPPKSHGVWACVNSACQRTGCDPNYIDCDSNPNTCDTSCVFTSATEQCDGKDDNCNCKIDENIIAPSPTQVCDVAPGVTDPGCLAGVGGVQLTCSGKQGWKCTFPSGYCDNTAGPNYCSSTVDVCDGKDNNCNGATDEGFKPPVLTTGYLGEPCASDDGQPPPGDGACRGTGQYVCNGPAATKCNAVKDLTKAGPELCDGIDNDCDGLVDEQFKKPGPNATYYVKPAVTRIGSVWVYQYEASRPGATSTDPGSGNGYQLTAPSGVTLDKTQSCSVPGVVPWFNVSPTEAAQVCVARGGRLCKTAEWQTACHATKNCTRGYAPHTNAACKNNGTYTGGNPPRICNIGPFDFDGNPANGIQDGLLPTASGSLSSCWADWSGTTGNTSSTDNIRDILGNLREITYNATVSPGGCSLTSPNGTCLFSLMGGAFNTQSENGAACDFTFFTVDKSFRLYDAGFRCCFDQNPD